MTETEQKLRGRQYSVSDFANLLDSTKAELTKNQRRAKWLWRMIYVAIAVGVGVIGFVLGILAAAN